MYTFTLTCFPKRTHNEKLVAVGLVCICLGICIGAVLEAVFFQGAMEREFKRIDHRATSDLNVVVGDIAELTHSISAANHIIVKGLTGIKEMLVVAANSSVDARLPKNGQQVWDYIPDPSRTLQTLGLIFVLGMIVFLYATATAATVISQWVSSAGPISHWIRGGYTPIDPTLTSRRNYLNGNCQIGCNFTIQGQKLESIPCIYVPELGAWMHCTAPSPLPSHPRRDMYDRTVSPNGMIEWLWNPWANEWSWVYIMPILIGDTTDAKKIELSRDMADALGAGVGPVLDYSDKGLMSLSASSSTPCTIGYDANNQAYCRIPVEVTRAAPHEHMY